MKESDEVKRMQDIQTIVARIVRQALVDEQMQLEPLTGTILENKLVLDKYRVSCRRGDPRFYKAIYTAVRFLYRTQDD